MSTIFLHQDKNAIAWAKKRKKGKRTLSKKKSKKKSLWPCLNMKRNEMITHSGLEKYETQRNKYKSYWIDSRKRYKCHATQMWSTGAETRSWTYTNLPWCDYRLWWYHLSQNRKNQHQQVTRRRPCLHLQKAMSNWRANNKCFFLFLSFLFRWD